VTRSLWVLNGAAFASRYFTGCVGVRLAGCRKTTLAASLAKRVGAEHLMASAVLRDYADRDTEVAGILRESWSRGENAPDEIVEPVPWSAYSTSVTKPVILDGYPRTPNQLKSFLARGGSIALAWSLNVSPEIALARTKARVGHRAIAASPIGLQRRILSAPSASFSRWPANQRACDRLYLAKRDGSEIPSACRRLYALGAHDG